MSIILGVPILKKGENKIMFSVVNNQSKRLHIN